MLGEGILMSLIERATILDLAQILALQKLAYKSEAEIYNDFSIPPLHQSITELNEDFKSQIILKATHLEKIIGSVRAYRKGNTCFIGKLIVHPRHQNKGIGTKLMNAIEKSFDNIKRYELFTGYKSKKNLYLYKKLGYKIFKTKVLNENIQLKFLEKTNEI